MQVDFNAYIVSMYRLHSKIYQFIRLDFLHNNARTVLRHQLCPPLHDGLRYGAVPGTLTNSLHFDFMLKKGWLRAFTEC